MRTRKLIDLYWLEERVAIKAEHLYRPTAKQLHDIREECLKEFRELYGEFEIVQWPRESTDPDRLS